MRDRDTTVALVGTLRVGQDKLCFLKKFIKVRLLRTYTVWVSKKPLLLSRSTKSERGPTWVVTLYQKEVKG
ncbi:MAG: hypothetical protein DRG83_18460 [Deltaproteobacteria bacterium]|nr:MAG: hypothetical protein DRG83_18460 [Deltaproteobacteria bacterium]